MTATIRNLVFEGGWVFGGGGWAGVAGDEFSGV